MTDLYIIAAGNGSRMGGTIPKALVPITDIPNLTTTLQQVSSKFERVFIIINELNQHNWDSYARDERRRFPELLDPERTNFIPIASGLGDGHAVLRGFEETASFEKLSDDVVICWGDVFIPHAEIMDELLSCDYASGVSGFVPAVRENDPYVTLLVDDRMHCVSADFSKYGECHQSGFHDQSVFRFKKPTLVAALSALHGALWKNGRYITPGGELSLLYAFHFLYNTGTPVQVYETNFPTLSFNTPAEVLEIQERISRRWDMERRKRSACQAR